MSIRKKVLIVDDSALFRGLIKQILSLNEHLEVVGEAEDPYQARDMIKSLSPDVLTLDVEMPKMDGITFLKNLMRLRPMPVVMVSSLTSKGASVTLEALDLGAIDFVTKPSSMTDNSFPAFEKEIASKVYAASLVNINKFAQHHSTLSIASNAKTIIESTKFSNDALIMIGASTGGIDAIKQVLISLPQECPPIVITQHIPPIFSQHFASRLNDITHFNVSEALHGEVLKAGHVYIAPGDYHFRVNRSGSHYSCHISQEPNVNGHRPSVEMLFDSALEFASHQNIIAVILTGMGNDGAAAMKRLHDRGVFTIAQDEETSVVWGMPGSAVKLEGVSKVLPIKKIGQEIMLAMKFKP